MHIIGVTGPIGHGKSTFAALLAECSNSAQLFESGTIVMEVANAWQKATSDIPQCDIKALNDWASLLPPILQSILHVEADAALLEFTSNDMAQDPAMFEKLFQYADLLNAQPHLLRQEITLTDKELFRPLLQWLGGYLVKMIDPGVWYDELLRRVVATNDIDLALITGLRFPGDAERVFEAKGHVVFIERPGSESRDQTDPTERERLTIPYQVHITNNGTLADLARLAFHVYQDIMNDTLKPSYITAPSE